VRAVQGQGYPTCPYCVCGFACLRFCVLCEYSHTQTERERERERERGEKERERDVRGGDGVGRWQRFLALLAP
jgi:hypothetical protein